MHFGDGFRCLVTLDLVRISGAFRVPRLRFRLSAFLSTVELKKFPTTQVSDRFALMLQSPPVVLTIAGFDPSSGAGITADIKTIAAHGCYGVSCITALTVQSTTGVQRVQPVEPALVTEMLEELAADMEIAAVHIGMLGSEKVVNAVEDFLEHRGLGNVVLDPILTSSSGARLIDAAGVRVMVERLLPIAAVVTPN